MPTISVVIPCYNEEKYLGKLLENLVSQTKKPDEVIVADCNSEDKTIKVAKTYSHNLPLKIAHTDIRSPGGARNAGAKIATGDYLLFIDADMRIPNQAIKKISDSLEAHSVDFLTPAYRSDGLHIADVLLIRSIDALMSLNMKYLNRIWAIGGVLCVKKSVNSKIHGFSVSANNEDIDYVHKLRKARSSYTYLDSLVTVTSSRRFKNQSLIVSLFWLLIENSLLGMWIFQPLIRVFGKQRKYGHYE